MGTSRIAEVGVASGASLRLRYACDAARLGAGLADKFVELVPDAACEQFLSAAQDGRHGVLSTLAHRTLRQLFSDFDVNGFLGMYSMHLLSEAQWRRLLGADTQARLLDVGAGDGQVTAPLARCFREVTATETSKPMLRRLRARGFSSHLLDVTHHPIPGAPYEAISLLNVLDRCAAPLTLLESVLGALAPGGRLIVALVLPYHPFFFCGSSTPAPLRPLPLNEAIEFEEAARRLCEDVLAPMGLVVETLSRAPYLSWGDSRVPVYELDDLVVIARREPLSAQPGS